MTILYKEWLGYNGDGVTFIANRLRGQTHNADKTSPPWNEYANQVRTLISTEFLDGFEIKEHSYFDDLIKGIVLGATFTEEDSKRLK